MHIKKVRFKNFTSYGNQIQELEFDDAGNLYLVAGLNGGGKSSLSSVVKYLLYGKVDGVNLSDLPNRINKNLWGEIEVICKNKLIKIERGISPGCFNIEIDGVPYDKAGKLDVQESLEKEYFEIPYNVFKNILVLSINDFKSLLTMSPGDKRAIVDKIFGYSIINEMKELVKKQRKDLKDEIKTFDDEISTIKDSIESVNRKLTELEKNSKNKNKEKIKDLKEKLQVLDTDRKKCISAKEKITESLSKIEDDLDKKSKLFNLKRNEQSKANEKLKLYENKKCPHCESDLTDDFHQNKKEKYEDVLKNSDTEIQLLQGDILMLRKSFDESNSKQHQIISKVSSFETTIESLKEELLKIIKGTGDNEQIDNFKSLVEEFRTKEEVKSKTKSNKSDEDYYLEILEDVLGDNGIKNLAMKTILPTLNMNISFMSKEIHLPFNVRFNDKFDCIITHLGEEINPKSLSTGERKKADFIIIIAMIKLMKLRFPTLNIIFLDEIFSSVDAEGVYNIINILAKTVKEINLNGFVINHTVLPSELFDKKLEVYKDQGFSKYTIEVLN